MLPGLAANGGEFNPATFGGGSFFVLLALRCAFRNLSFGIN